MELLIILGLIGIIIVIFGAYLLTGRIVTMHRRVDMVILWLVFLTTFYINNSCYNYTDNYYIFVYLLLLVVAIVLVQGKYVVYNTKKTPVTEIMVQILDEKSIRYELNESSITLLDYDNGEITFRDVENSVGVKFKGINKVAGYSEIIRDMKNRAKQIPEKAFPTSGVVFIIMGVFLIALTIFMALK